MRISGSSAWNDGGAVLRKASPIQEERFVSQGHRRRSMEVPCSGVPFGFLAFEMAVGFGRYSRV